MVSVSYFLLLILRILRNFEFEVSSNEFDDIYKLSVWYIKLLILQFSSYVKFESVDKLKHSIYRLTLIIFQISKNIKFETLSATTMAVTSI